MNVSIVLTTIDAAEGRRMLDLAAELSEAVLAKQKSEVKIGNVALGCLRSVDVAHGGPWLRGENGSNIPSRSVYNLSLAG